MTRTLKLLLVVALITACGGRGAGGGTGGGGTAGTGGGSAQGTRCPGWDLKCDPATQFCVDNYAGAWSGPHPVSCQTYDAGCATNRTCACVTQGFHCGITTYCNEDAGIVTVTCSPD